MSSRFGNAELQLGQHSAVATCPRPYPSFAHPLCTRNSPLRRQYLYPLQISASAWLKSGAVVVGICRERRVVLFSILLHPLLTVTGVERNFHINQNPFLHSLTIPFWETMGGPHPLLRLFSVAGFPQLEEIAIGTILPFGVVAWGELDDLLAQPPFSKLRTFWVNAGESGSMWFIDHLPQSSARGILSFQSVRQLELYSESVLMTRAFYYHCLL